MPVTQGEARSYLARFLFRGDDVEKEVRTLSGGERSRLELALLGITPANLLLLDEPTNHLDIPAREAIEAFIREVPATVLVVSHDRRLLEELVERLWVVDDGLAVPFDGGYREWRAGGRGRLDGGAGRPKPRRAGCGSGRRRPRDGRRPARPDERLEPCPIRRDEGRRAAATVPRALPTPASLRPAGPPPPRSSRRRPIAARRPLPRRSSRGSASVAATSSSR